MDLRNQEAVPISETRNALAFRLFSMFWLAGIRPFPQAESRELTAPEVSPVGAAPTKVQ
jgi:hypothetical protein